MEKWKTCHVAIMYIARMNCHVLSVLLGGRASWVKQIVRQRGAIEVPACPTDMTICFPTHMERDCLEETPGGPFCDNYAKIVCFRCLVLTSNHLFM